MATDRTRTTTWFAILPVRLDDGSWCWWAWYTLTEIIDDALTTEWGEVWFPVSRRPITGAPRR